MKKIVAILIAGVAIGSGLSYAQSATETEIIQTILDGNEYTRTNLKSDPDGYSQHGALEFWSSGGLLNEIAPGGRPDEYDTLNIEAKHRNSSQPIARPRPPGRTLREISLALGSVLNNLTQLLLFYPSQVVQD